MSRQLSNRIKRTILALLNGSIMRENLDAIAGCSNSPNLISGLRRKGLSIPCEKVERFDKDGNSCWPGRYSFTADDKVLANNWLQENHNDFI